MNKNISLLIHDVSVSVLDKQILNTISISVDAGSTHAIMGPNGSGKSTLAYALIGHPLYQVTSGSAMLNGQNILIQSPHERARAGLFLSFQNPPEIPGVSVFSFLKESYNAIKGTPLPVQDFKNLVLERCNQLNINESFLSRSLNEGFSGGEKKRFELLQLLLLQPSVVILDEIDSGLDIDALKIVSSGLNIARSENPQLSIILITHYRRILDYVEPDFVHVLCNGTIVRTGGNELIDVLEAEGYDGFRQK